MVNGKEDKESKDSKETKEIKEGRPKRTVASSSQPTLDGKVVRKVTFAADDRELKEFKEKTVLELRKLKQDALEIEKVKVEIKARDLEIVERLEKLEKRVKEIEDRERIKAEKWEHWREDIELRLSALSMDGATEPSSTQSSLWNVAGGSAAASVRSGVSVGSGLSRVSLSERDVVQMKKLLADKIKFENQDVIIIRGCNVNENEGQIKQEVSNLLKNRLGVNVEIVNTWVRGKVVMAKLKSYEDKERVMRNKNKLAGSKIFIENFRSFDERKRQEEISAWVKDKKDKGWEMKIGFGRILYKNVWVKWEDREKLEKRMVDDEKKKKAESGESASHERDDNVTEEKKKKAESEESASHERDDNVTEENLA